MPLFINKGETFSPLGGESGLKKTTIGRAIIIWTILAREISSLMERESRSIKIQMIFQDPAAFEWTCDSWLVLSEGLHFHLFKRWKKNVRKGERYYSRGRAVIRAFLTRYPHEFSRWSRQNDWDCSRLLWSQILWLLRWADFSTDVSGARTLNLLLKKFQKRSRLIYLFMSIDLSVVRFISDRIAVIYKGVIVVAETRTLNNPIHPYTQSSLLSAVPIPDPILERSSISLWCCSTWLFSR